VTRSRCVQYRKKQAQSQKPRCWKRPDRTTIARRTQVLLGPRLNRRLPSPSRADHFGR
jgi:hypothetical protein